MTNDRSGKSSLAGLSSAALAAAFAAVGLWWFLNRQPVEPQEMPVPPAETEASIGPDTNAAAPAEPVVMAEPEPEPPPPEPTEPRPPSDGPLAAYYHLDEKDGAQFVVDSTGNGRSGRLGPGATAGASGQIKLAVNFSRDRGGQITVMEPLNLHTNTVTIAAWVKRRGAQLANAVLVYGRGGDSEAGLHLGQKGELCYTWNRDTRRHGWSSGLTLPDGVWALVVLAVDAGKATLYLGVPEQDLVVAENAIDHSPAEFSGALTIGRDPILGASFNGMIDEVGLWRKTLGRAEVEALFKAGQLYAQSQAAAHNPPPADAKTVAAPTNKPGGWADADYKRALAIYADALSEFGSYLRTRQNPSILRRIEDNLHKCVDTLESCKARAPANVDVQEQIDRCNKLIFDVHATKQVGT